MFLVLQLPPPVLGYSASLGSPGLPKLIEIPLPQLPKCLDDRCVLPCLVLTKQFLVAWSPQLRSPRLTELSQFLLGLCVCSQHSSQWRGTAE